MEFGKPQKLSNSNKCFSKIVKFVNSESYEFDFRKSKFTDLKLKFAIRKDVAIVRKFTLLFFLPKPIREGEGGGVCWK